ncbi:hypothetical protein Aduo_018968 [Ancylostoma duodenale]
MDSGNTRRQIGIRKKQLIAIEQISRDHKQRSGTQLLKTSPPSERGFLAHKINYCRSMPKSSNCKRTGPKLRQAIRRKKKYSNNMWRSFVKCRLRISEKHDDNPKPPHSGDKQQGWTRSSQPQTNLTSTMNFVDAFILSTGTPSFDGNILEYPKFFSRLSTLCTFAGRCKKDTYDNTKITERLKEFSKPANNHS